MVLRKSKGQCCFVGNLFSLFLRAFHPRSLQILKAAHNLLSGCLAEQPNDRCGMLMRDEVRGQERGQRPNRKRGLGPKKLLCAAVQELCGLFEVSVEVPAAQWNALRGFGCEGK